MPTNKPETAEATSSKPKTSASTSANSAPKNKSVASPKVQTKKASDSNEQAGMRFEISNDMLLEDCAIIKDVLTTQKTLIKNYGFALCEGSTDKLRCLLNHHLAEIAEDQFDSFLYMKEKGLYPEEVAPSDKITEAKQKFKQTEQEMKKS